MIWDDDGDADNNGYEDKLHVVVILNFEAPALDSHAGFSNLSSHFYKFRALVATDAPN